MRSIKLFLAILILLSFCFGTFSRPWFSKTWVATNPNIWSYGIEYWWNLPEFDRTVSSTNYEQLFDLSTSLQVRGYLDQSISYGELSRKNKDKCIMDIILAIGTFSPSSTFMAAFANSSDCRNYKRNWIKTVDFSLLSLEESENVAQEAISSARVSYEKAKFLGLCDQNYSGPGKDDCVEVYYAFSAVDNNITEGKYGQYSLFSEYSTTIQTELSQPIPDLSLSSSMMRLVWDDQGILHSFSNLKNQSEQAAIKAEQEFQSQLKSASAHKSTAEKALAEIKKEDLKFITNGIKGNGVSGIGSISERLTNLEKEVTLLNSFFSESQIKHGHVTEQSYLTNSIILVTETDVSYTTIPQKVDSLKEDATLVLSQQKQEAENEILETENFFTTHIPNSDAIDYYTAAKKKFEEGNTMLTIGSAFMAYSKAASLARAARTTGDYKDELQIRVLLATLEDLISRAEADNINVIDEKESLELLRSLNSYNSDVIIQNAIDNIILKARTKYESDLLAIHVRIYDKLYLSGPVSNDLEIELENAEFGLFDENLIRFPEAIGSLKKLKTNYLNIEKKLDFYIQKIVGTSMATSTFPIFGEIKLDEPVDITLNVILTNGPYSATNVEVPINIGTEIPFLYSDIKQGRDDVSGLYVDANELILIIKSVEPYDITRIALEKSLVIAHTFSHETKADGLGSGMVSVSDKMEFDLDYPVPRITLPNDFIEPKIDGSVNSGPLSAGRHMTTSEKTVYGYDEEVSNIRTTNLGSNTKVEYDITILSEFDLNTLPLFINSQNDSHISSFDISISGAGIKDKKRVSDSQINVVLSNIRKNTPTVLKVSYVVDDPAAFITSQIAQLQQSNPTDPVQELLENASYQTSLGNFDKALELIEKAKAASAEVEKQQAKLDSKYTSLSNKATNEIESLEKIILEGNSSEILQKLETRKTELEKVLNDNMTVEQKITKLETIDFEWLPKELTSFKKDAYNQYNDLKERFYLAGNSTTPPEFLDLETALAKLETSGQVEYIPDVSKALESVKNLVEDQEEKSKNNRDLLFSSFSSIKSEVLNILDKYSKQTSAAKGTEYSNFFTESNTKINKLLGEAEDLLNKDERQYLAKLVEINTSKDKMELTLESLKQEAESKILSVEALLTSGQYDQSKKSDLEVKLQTMKGMVDAGEYVNALRTGSTILKEMDSTKPEPNNLLLLGVTALAILGGVGFYMMQQQKPKELKKLPSLREGSEPEEKS
ncbi:Uncharacterised protein [Candidatus Bilamarchaeum dharawalense]|uniref:Uncharacterized protein n=1 Tax=Candidatus Bilamarchaeum dharawalense TaxID=2885759 RepID=A0A5E4LWS4_9ARCH|nr:Uncharacterised protein [Candidatus Bilamarchaeum dharawalense]